MRWLDFLTSTKRPADSVPAVSAEEMRERLLGLNRPTAPWRVIDGAADADLVAEWKIVDAEWYELFAKAGLEKVFRISLKLDPAAREVRALDREYTVAWEAGLPRLSLAVNRFRGQKQTVQFGTAYAFTEELKPGQVYRYRFATRELKGPLQKAVTDGGWTYKGVTFGKF